jgi:2-aminoethylphosphonate-pyruvate transaminase
MMQGSGTFGVESVIQTVTNDNSKMLILENGSYGQRISKICKLLRVEYYQESFPEDRRVDIKRVESILKKSKIKFTDIVK